MVSASLGAVHDAAKANVARSKTTRGEGLVPRWVGAGTGNVARSKTTRGKGPVPRQAKAGKA